MGQEVPSCAAPQSLKCSGHREFSLPAESSRIDIVISCGSQRPRPSASSARVNAWMEKLEPAAARGEPREAEELEVSATGNPYKGECGDQSSFRRLGIAKHTRYVSTYPLQCLESTKPYTIHWRGPGCLQKKRLVDRESRRFSAPPCYTNSGQLSLGKIPLAISWFAFWHRP